MVRVLISLRSAPGNADRAMVTGAGGQVRYAYRHVHGMAASLPEQAIEALRRNPRVAAVEPDGILQASVQELPWGVDRIDDRTPPQVTGNRGAGVQVAIIDSGIDYNHPDLDPNCDETTGWDFVNGDDDPMDDYGHGTHCAGIVAAADNDLGVVGVAPDATLHALKVLDASGMGYESDLIAALGRCIDDGIQVASMSMGGRTASSLLEPACDAAENAGIVLVAAAGNSGRASTRRDTVEYPAKFASVIAVGATTWGSVRPRWSSTGPALELAAPGENIYSTYLVGAGNPADYATMSGTSMACPHVSGAAALAIAAGVFGPQAVRDRLTSTADDLGPAGRDVEYGFGLVDADEAAGEAGNSAPDVWISAPEDGATFAEDAVIDFAGSASDVEDGDLTASLVWTSSRDGEIGAGGGFSAQLSVGVHTITAEVQDSGGLTGFDTITVTVQTSGGGQLDVAVSTDKDTYDSGETVYITVLVTTGSPAAAVSGAGVELRLTTPKGKVYVKTGTTDSGGVATFTHRTFTRRDGAGAYTADAVASMAGYTDGSGTATFEAY